MIFLSYWFFAFVALSLALYWVAPRNWMRPWILLVSSVVFQWHFAGPAGVLPIYVLLVLTWIAGLVGNRGFILFAIATNVLVLIFYKYTVFLLGSAATLSGFVSAQDVADFVGKQLPSAPPLAISFFVFEFVHYLIEVLRGRAPIASPKKFALFGLFWPTLVAGPIKRFPEFVPEVERGANHVGKDDLAFGTLRIAEGLAMKFAADTIAVFIDYYTTGGNFASIAVYERWLVAVAISFRILFDFSGYSSIAIGYARLMGIRIPENFNFPYLATNLQEFWRRWHISLSSWVRDYIYIPLGGNRSGPARRVVNGLIAFGIIGLWHGAGWNFVLWGLWHGVGLAIHSQVAPRLDRIVPTALAGLRMLLGWLITYVFVLIGWIMFFYPSGEFEGMILLMFGIG